MSKGGWRSSSDINKQCHRVYDYSVIEALGTAFCRKGIKTWNKLEKAVKPLDAPIVSNREWSF